MTLVRHLFDIHNVDYEQGNQIVDELYMAKATPYQMTIDYQHLNADECEELKQQVRDKEKEFGWGTYGPNRDEALQEYTIDKLSTQHLENILITQPQIPNDLAAAILMLLKKRYGAL